MMGINQSRLTQVFILFILIFNPIRTSGQTEIHSNYGNHDNPVSALFNYNRPGTSNLSDQTAFLTRGSLQEPDNRPASSLSAAELPAGCNLTSLIEYVSSRPTQLRDFINTPDGGTVAVGDIWENSIGNNNGLVVKFSGNGEVEWAKSIDNAGGAEYCARIIRLPDDNMIIFSTRYYKIGYNGLCEIIMYKINPSGGLLESKKVLLDESYSYNDYQVGDVFSFPDGGFVILINDAYGTGEIFPYVIRFDDKMNIVWKKEIKHDRGTSVYNRIYCTQKAVYIGAYAYDYAHLNEIILLKLDFATGKDEWTNAYTFESPVVAVNNLIVINDTIYAFINQFFETDRFMGQPALNMIKVSDGGTLIGAVSLHGDLFTHSTFGYEYTIENRPTISLASSGDFITANQSKTPEGLKLNISAFDRDGKIKWSKNYPSLNNHFVYNIKPRASGMAIIGTAGAPTPQNSLYTNTFILQVDKSGEINGSAGTNCLTEQAFMNTSSVTVLERNLSDDSVTNMMKVTLTGNNQIPADVQIQPVLYCYRKANCTMPVLSGDKSNCGLSDTLTYYLENNDCEASAKWNFDTSFFRLVSMSSDTLRLKGIRTGTSSVKAIIEMFCGSSADSIVTQITRGASDLNLTGDTVLCAGKKAIISAGAGFFNYKWDTGQTDSAITISNPGKYKIEVTDHCGRTATDSIVITGIPAGISISGKSAMCSKDTIELTAESGFQNYQWAPSGYLAPSGNKAIVYPLQTTNFFLTAVTKDGCHVLDSFLVKVYSPTPLDIGKDTALCPGESFPLNAPPGFQSYTWNTGSNAQTINAVSPNIYSVTGVDANGCKAYDTIAVKQFDFRKPALGPDTAICAGAPIRLYPGKYINYEWSTGTVNQSAILVGETGTYWVKVTDENNCTGSDTMAIVNLRERPEGYLEYNMEICYGEQVTIKSLKPFRSYQWSTGETASSISVNQAGLYHLTVTDRYGCIGKDSVIVSNKQDCSTGIFFYNAFTPNLDGLNDLFKPAVKGRLEKYSFSIYNRFGQVVFETNNPSKGWDGYFRNEISPAGVYVYKCIYKFFNSPEVMNSGSVTLIR